MAVNKPVTFRKRHYKAKLETFCLFQFAIGDSAQNEPWIPDTRNQDDRTYISSHTRFGARWFQTQSPADAPFNGSGAFLKDTIFIVAPFGWTSVLISLLTGTLVLICRLNWIVSWRSASRCSFAVGGRSIFRVAVSPVVHASNPLQ